MSSYYMFSYQSNRLKLIIVVCNMALEFEWVIMIFHDITALNRYGKQTRTDFEKTFTFKSVF